MRSNQDAKENKSRTKVRILAVLASMFAAMNAISILQIFQVDQQVKVIAQSLNDATIILTERAVNSSIVANPATNPSIRAISSDNDDSSPPPTTNDEQRYLRSSSAQKTLSTPLTSEDQSSIRSLATSLEGKEDTPLSNDDSAYPFTFSACLMIKDDIIVLPEWLAYHYTFLPLRRLIVAVDPLSEIDPEPLLNVYRDLGMNITIWRDLFYAKKNGKWHFERPDFMQVYPNATKKQRRNFINYQQTSFYTACLRQLKQENRSWTMLIDVDEYLEFNTYNPDEGVPSHCKTLKKGKEECHDEFVKEIESGNHSRSNLHHYVGEKTLADYIASGQDPMLRSDAPPCRIFPRYWYGSLHEPAQDVVPDGFDSTYFHTLRFRKYSAKQTHLPGKSLFDVSRYDGKAVHDVHRPQIYACSTGKHAWSPFSHASIRINHYIGTLDSFLRPGADVRGAGAYHKRNEQYAKDWVGVNEEIVWWLPKFIALVGREKALHATQHAREQAMEMILEWNRQHSNQTSA